MKERDFYDMVRESFEKAYDLYEETNLDADLDAAQRIAQDMLNIEDMRNSLITKE